MISTKAREASEVKHSAEREEISTSHAFCWCQFSKRPLMESMCGIVKDDWKPATPLPPERCAMCIELFGTKCPDCGEEL